MDSPDTKFSPGGLTAVVFDYGNTLVEFAAAQIDYCDSELAATLETMFGKVNRDKLTKIRNRDRRAPYTGDLRENNMEEITVNLVQALYDQKPTNLELEELLRVRHVSFVEAVSHPEYLIPVLHGLKQKYRLGLLSNYPCANSVRESLARGGLEKLFHAITISAEVGHVKPHPLPFTTILKRLNVNPEEAIYVGDNWLGDVQGSKQMGMKCAYTVQWDTPEKFKPRPGDCQPDIIISSLKELADYLM